MVEKIALMAFNALLWIIWAITRYFYNLLSDNEKNFSFSIFAFSLFVWMWVWIMIGEFTPDNQYADWIKILCGILSFEIVESLSKKGKTVVKSLILKRFK